VELADQLVASAGCSIRFWFENVRYSPVWASMSRPPWSATVSGSIVAVGTTIPALIVAPAAPPPELGEVVGVEELELPQAETTAPSTGSDIPMTVPRRRNSLRESRPAAYSSMT
jgi:hypothetical protein